MLSSKTKILMTENEIFKQIIGAAIDVHKHLGFGLSESSCQVCLAYELIQRGLNIQSQVALPVIYKEVKL